MISRINSPYQVGRMNRIARRKSDGSGFVPTDIAGCLLWLDFADADTLFADAGSTKVTADGDPIYQANDKSGNNYHFAVYGADNTRRPLYKTNVQNNLSSALFDGVNDTLGKEVAALNCYNKTLFTVGKFGIKSNSAYLITSHKRCSLKYTKGVFVLGDNNANTPVITATWDTHSNVLMNYLLSNEGFIRINGALKATGALTTGGKNKQYLMSYDGYSEMLGGHIYEHIMYSTALSDTDRGKVETYLNNKWAIY